MHKIVNILDICLFNEKQKKTGIILRIEDGGGGFFQMYKIL